MSFLFKKTKGGGTVPNSALPNVSRDIRSSDGPGSQIPQPLNGMMQAPNGNSRVGSPQPQQLGSVNNSLSSLAGNINGDSGRSNSAPPQEELARQQYMRTQMNGVGARGSGPPSPEQKSLSFRDPSRETVCYDTRLITCQGLSY